MPRSLPASFAIALVSLALSAVAIVSGCAPSPDALAETVPRADAARDAGTVGDAVRTGDPAGVGASPSGEIRRDTGLVLQLVRTRDILAELAADPPRPALVVGFAAETDNVERNARAKLASKRVDLICANRVGVAGGGFESDDNALVVYGAGIERALGPASKAQLAEALVALVAEHLAENL